MSLCDTTKSAFVSFAPPNFWRFGHMGNCRFDFENEADDLKCTVNGGLKRERYKVGRTIRIVG